MNIVISRYNRDTSWSAKFVKVCPDANIMIYDKEKPENPFNVPRNKGNEASTYLKYIVDHYDVLPEYTFFCHDEEFAWHHSGSIISHFEIACLSKKKYYNVNDKIILGNIENNDYGYPTVLKWYMKYIDKHIPYCDLPNKNWTQGFRGSAQFLVHRDTIRCLPKDFYEYLYEWILNTNLSSAESGRYMEWCWHLFWYIYPEQMKHRIT
jgi:hypothetical protein